MKEQINPSYSNRIYIENEPHIETSLVEIIDNDKEWFLEYEFEPSVVEDYIAVTAKTMYVEKAIRGDIKVSLITVRVRYRIIKDHDLTATELYAIVTYNTDLLIRRFREAPPIQLKHHSIPTCPELSQMNKQLEALAEDLNISKKV